MATAARYAKTAISLAIEKNKLEDLFTDILYIKEVCNVSSDFIQFINNPIINSDKKSKTIQTIFDKKISTFTLDFLNLVFEKNREKLVPEISNEIIKQYHLHKGIIAVTLTSAYAIDDKEKNDLKLVLQKQLNKTIELTEKIKPNLIGGFILDVDGKQLNMSVSNRLHTLKKQLIQSK